ncbi:MAG: recombinase family protein [Phycisphaerae bacterium]|nr:recombinase family protein [Phycisphaerae bacterium]
MSVRPKAPTGKPGSNGHRTTLPKTRCAIYTRKSSDEGLQQEFNSLDAQRDAAEAYIASQKTEGWLCNPDRYDDGGFTGGNMERPALKRLLADIDAGKIDCVVVYKVDRLSRSLMDFARIVEIFERHQVSFVSVTQHFNTTHSMGRLTLNILLSFAQFEREIIGERIRDKIAASRQRGKWTGGTPVLGYDVDRSTGSPRLIVNPTEAIRVQQIFELYLEHGSLVPTAAELEKRKWFTKVWKTRQGKERGGEAFDKCRLHGLLTNFLYVGKVQHRGQVYAGEHEPILSEDLFRRVRLHLERNGRHGGAEIRNRYGALLRRLLYCKACRRVMTHTYTSKGNRHYRYYTCTTAMKRGWAKCPTKSLPALEIERAVLEQIRMIGEDPALLTETLQQARLQIEASIERLTGERRIAERGLGRCHAEVRRLAASGFESSGTTARIADLNDQVAASELRLAELDAQLAELRGELVTPADVNAAFADFANVWSAMKVREQVRLIQLLVARVEFDAEDSSIEVSFYPAAIKALAGGMAGPQTLSTTQEECA